MEEPKWQYTHTKYTMINGEILYMSWRHQGFYAIANIIPNNSNVHYSYQYILKWEEIKEEDIPVEHRRTWS